MTSFKTVFLCMIFASYSFCAVSMTRPNLPGPQPSMQDTDSMMHTSKQVGDQKKKKNDWVRNTARFVLNDPYLGRVIRAAATVTALNLFVGGLRYTPTPSMEPTVKVQQKLAVEKITYLFRDPQRGDIITFKLDDGLMKEIGVEKQANYPILPFWKDYPSFLKRVIGLPGETISLKDGEVWIDGVRLKEDYLKEAALPYGEIANFSYQIPEDHYFVMGDNRNNSADSRFFKAIPRSVIETRVAAEIETPELWKSRLFEVPSY